MCPYSLEILKGRKTNAATAAFEVQSPDSLVLRDDSIPTSLLSLMGGLLRARFNGENLALSIFETSVRKVAQEE